MDELSVHPLIHLWLEFIKGIFEDNSVLNKKPIKSLKLIAIQTELKSEFPPALMK